MIIPPSSRMDILTPAEIEGIVAKSKLKNKYSQTVDSQSAYEILNAKLAEAATNTAATGTSSSGRSAPAEKSTLDKILDNSVVRQAGRTAASMITRSLLGALGLGGRTSSKKSSWF